MLYTSISSDILFYSLLTMNVNASSLLNKQDNITLDDIKNNPDKIKDLDEYTLNSFLDQSTKDKNYDTIVLLASELSNREKKEENIEPDSELQKTLAEDNQKSKEFNKKLNEEKKYQESANEIKLSQLTVKLNDALIKIQEMEEEFKTLNKINREQNSAALEKAKEAQNFWNSKELKNKQNEINWLMKEKKLLEEKYKVELLKYPPDEMAKLSTKRIKWRFIKIKHKKTADWKETKIERPNLKINKNIRSRRKLNQVVKSFNWFKEDSDSAVKYVLTQERQTRLDHISWWAALKSAENRWRYNLLHKMWFVMSKEKFETKFDIQQEKIIGKFKNDINPTEWSTEEKTIKALEDRMLYYKKDYMKKHYWK